MTNRIKQLRNQKGLTLEELSELTGISTSHLSRIEKPEQAGGNARGLTLANAIRIGRALQTDVIDFTDEFSEEDVDEASRLELPSIHPARGDIQNLAITAGMGIGRLEQIEGATEGTIPPAFVNGHWTFPESIRERFTHIAQTHALPVVGDSMEPTLRDGAIVFVDTTHTVPSPPDLYAVDYGDGLMVKRIQLIPKSKKVRVISDNVERYETYELDREDLRVFGRVVARFQWR